MAFWYRLYDQRWHLVRDFIHVSDLAQAHLDVMDYIMKHNSLKSLIVVMEKAIPKEVLDIVQRISGTQLNIEHYPRRVGSPH